MLCNRRPRRAASWARAPVEASWPCFGGFRSRGFFSLRSRRGRRSRGQPAAVRLGAAGFHGGFGLGAQFEIGDFLLDQGLDALPVLALFLGQHGEGLALAARAAGAADAVDVVLRMGGHVEVEDVADFRNVEAAGRDVRRDQIGDLVVAEGLQRLEAGRLVHVAMERARR